jgi:hypothetical protein
MGMDKHLDISCAAKGSSDIKQKINLSSDIKRKKWSLRHLPASDINIILAFGP